MRELRIGTWAVVMVALVAFGCDDDNGGRDGGGGDTDSGMVRTDGGGGGDAGGGDVDGGRMADSGTNGGSCGPTGGECDISDPMSCGLGMACVLRLIAEGSDEASTFCQPAGTADDGIACTRGSSGECAEGFDCSQYDDVCRRNCCSDADCNPPGMATGQICRRFSNGGPAGMEVGICVAPDSCSVIEQTGCEGGEVCDIFDRGLTHCTSPGTATEGVECAGVGCVGGFGCLGTATEPATCKKYCDLTMDGAGCGAGQACNGRIGDGSGGARTDVGFCVPE